MDGWVDVWMDRVDGVLNDHIENRKIICPVGSGWGREVLWNPEPHLLPFLYHFIPHSGWKKRVLALKS